MNKLNEFELFLTDLQGVDSANAKVAFTGLFVRGCLLLDLDDDKAAKVFDTSRPNASRWRRGKVVPPAAGLVLRFMREEVEARIKTLKKIESQAAATSSSGRYGPSALPMAAKGR